MVKNYDNMLSRFYLIPERYGRTDGQTDGRMDRIAISISLVSALTSDKNVVFFIYAVEIIFRPSVSLSVCLSVCDALDLRVNTGFLQTLFTLSERPQIWFGCENKHRENIRNRLFSSGDVEAGMKKIAIFDQYLASFRKRYKIAP